MEAVGETVPGDVGTAGSGLMPGIMGAFYSQAAPVTIAPALINGNTEFAVQYAREMRELAVAHANNDPRSLQKHLGPSEIGHSCSRQIVAKLADLPVINHTTDPWASIMGRAGHKWTEELRLWVNATTGQPRFLPEFRVKPGGSGGAFLEHDGSSDAYDAEHNAVVDDKFLGDTSMGKLKQHGPPRHYWTQFLLYRRGLLALGLPVDRIILLAWPRTRSTLDAMYVWEHVVTDEDERFLDDVIAPELLWRKQWAAAVLAGTAQINDVPMDTEDSCQWCPIYRPQSVRDGAYGCPGHTAGN